MVQHQSQRTFSLLQRYFSQQETMPVSSIGSPSILSNKLILQAYARQTGSDVVGLAQHQAIPINFDLTTYQPILTNDSDPMLDQTVTMRVDPMLDQAGPLMDDGESDQVVPLAAHSKKMILLRATFVISIVIVSVAIYLIWHPVNSGSSSPIITRQNLSGATPKVSSSKSSVATNTAVNSSGYTLPSDARVYQLLLAAGGPLPKADLVSLNLAAKLNDGQEIYVTLRGESPPTVNSSLSGTSSSSSSNQSLVNINTASADDLRQKLSISSKTAQSIVNYRQQHGPFTSVDQLLQVVSKSIYDKIKDKVTV
jgi:competence protein ComEA